MASMIKKCVPTASHGDAAAAIARRQTQRFVVDNKYCLKFAYTKEGKFVLPFSRRMVNIDLQFLIDEHNACLSINCGGIDVLMHYLPADTSKKIIRIIDEQWDECDLLRILTQ